MPCFYGKGPGETWLPPPVIDGERQSPLLNASGLAGQDLTKPSAVRYVDPVNGPQNETEWDLLWKQSFDDIAREASLPLALTQVAFDRRVALERAYFGGTGVSRRSVPQVLEKNKKDNYRFQFRYSNRFYGLATLIQNVDKVDQIYQRMNDRDRKYDSTQLQIEFRRRFEESSTTAEVDALVAVLSYYRSTDKFDKSVSTAAADWSEKCVAKRFDLAREEERAAAEKGKTPQEARDDDEDAKRENKEAAESGTVPVIRTCHVVSSVSYPLPQASRYLFEEGMAWPAVSLNPAHAPKPLEDAELGLKCRFDWITEERIGGMLYTVSALPNSGSAKWRASKARINVPSAIDGTEKECLVVDHFCAQVLAMPAGEPTDECYWIVKPGSGAPTDFKVHQCSLSKTHILISGFRRGQDVCSVIVIDRAQKWVTFVCTSVPLSTAKLSAGRPDTALLGMMEGTILRLPLGHYRAGLVSVAVYAPYSAKAVRAMDPAKLETDIKNAADGAAVVLAATRKYHGGLSAIATAQKLPGASCRVEMFEAPDGDHQDWIAHVGRISKVTRIVDRGRRMLAATHGALHLFRQFGLAEKTLSGTNGGNRRVSMALEGTCSYDFRGNLLVAHKENNSVQLLQLHTYRLEALIPPPKDLSPPPPDSLDAYPTVSLHDGAITIFHPDGSRRIIEMNPTSECLRPVVAPSSSSSSSKNGKKSSSGGKGKK